MTLNGMKIKLSGAKNQKFIGTDKVRRTSGWKHTNADMGIVNMIRQRLKDIELQRWLSEINNDTRKDANQGNEMRT